MHTRELFDHTSQIIDDKSSASCANRRCGPLKC